MEQVVLWIVGGVTALLGAAVAAAVSYDRLHRRRATLLGKRRKPKIQL